MDWMAEGGWTRCPSAFKMACAEAGDVAELARASITFHARHCSRCGQALLDLGLIREELLGRSAPDRVTTVRRAAEDIRKLLRGVPLVAASSPVP